MFEINKKVESCKRCDFYFSSMDGMECIHPIMVKKGAYNNMIISHDEKISSECPLRNKSLVVTYSLKI